ncbi:MAG TPA: hypothetical protein VM847_15180, partial [Tahibacter sp.]|nr:hypothetical protein [Tahibacter sp.]
VVARQRQLARRQRCGRCSGRRRDRSGRRRRDRVRRGGGIVGGGVRFALGLRGLDRGFRRGPARQRMAAGDAAEKAECEQPAVCGLGMIGGIDGRNLRMAKSDGRRRLARSTSGAGSDCGRRAGFNECVAMASQCCGGLRRPAAMLPS